MKKSLAASGYDVERNNSRVNRAARTLVNKETAANQKDRRLGLFHVSIKSRQKPKRNQSKRKRFRNLERLQRRKGWHTRSRQRKPSDRRLGKLQGAPKK
ncbi:UNVERIFIED_CONTAM: hypothetical protein FKN15_070617 [Acipenser sinensis]